ncbi:MAG TPA: hypothetical protein VMD97_05920 [Candidatus Aquilonibacter sp.]|nr:hypothetical protein [Candidatus Aquilonibacter sp.]
MENSRVKMRVGGHEFEAEGSPEVVQQQLEAFKALILAQPPGVNNERQLPTESGLNDEPGPTIVPSSAHVRLENILHADGRVISLTALPNTVEEAALLIMLGQKELRNNVSVTGQEIGDGLDQSGKPASRVDRIMEKHIRDAFVLKTGLGRATRYRLTNQGLMRALTVARELIATLP